MEKLSSSYIFFSVIFIISFSRELAFFDNFFPMISFLEIIFLYTENVLIEMDVFPLTTNGKLDTKALPIPDFNTLEDDFIEPASKEEESLCSIWQEILGLEKIGTTDDFFKKGGNSILALQTSHRMSKALNVEVSVSEIFKFKSIKMIIENTVVEEMDSKNEEWEFSI